MKDKLYTFKDGPTVTYEVVNRWFILLWKTSVYILSAYFFNNPVQLKFLVKNYIAVDSAKISLSIAELQEANHTKRMPSHSQETLQNKASFSTILNVNTV